jgi:hypothetical protein
MPLGSLIKEPPKVEEKKPSQEELLAAEQAKRQELEQQMRERDAANKARLEQMEHEMGRKFAQSRQGEAAPQPSEYYQAQQKLNLTDEQILANPSQTIPQLVEHIAGKHIGAYNQQVSQVLGQNVQWRVNEEFEALKSHPYYDHLKGYLKEYFEDHPQEQIQAGNIKRKFNELIGQHHDELIKKTAPEGDPPAERSRTRAVEPAITPPSPAGKPAKEKEFVLDPDPERAEAKREIISIYNQFGANLTEEEFNQIEEGKLLPKKRSMAIQMGRERSNVEY